MRKFVSTLLFAAVLALSIAVSARAVAHADTFVTPTAARISLWDDTDHDGIVGSTGDTLRGRLLANNGAFSFAASDCTKCAVVIDRVVTSTPSAGLSVNLLKDGVASQTMAIFNWTDGGADGAWGNANDVLNGIATSTGGVAATTGALCTTCGAVVVDWGGSTQDIDWIGSTQDIDTVSGAVIEWGGSTQDIDWIGSGDDIDWIGSGDDIDWIGSGDDIDWIGSGDDIDWIGSGDDIDVARESRR